MNTREWESKLIEQIPRLRRYARYLTQDKQSADDLVQDCLEKAWKKRNTWRAGSNLRAWLFTIMHNVFLNALRRKKISDNYLQSQHTTEPEVSDEHNLVLRDLEICLAKLKPEYREVLILASVENLTYKEISEVINAPLGTVMSRLSRGRESLREIMSGPTKPKLVRML